MVRLIISVNRHESPELAMQVVELAVERIDKGILGLDLAGNEVHYPATPFIDVFNHARQAGLHATVHAGEWGGAGNVAMAILQLGAERIGHGVRVVEDPAVVAMAREHATTFEVCVTSNFQSGVVQSVDEHPISEMLEQELNATINTDDPSISQITLGDEYRMVCEDLGFSLDALRGRVLAAAQSSFLPAEEKVELVTKLSSEIDSFIADHPDR